MNENPSDYFSLSVDSGLIIKASPASSQHDFDFYVGKWSIHNRKLRQRLANCDDWTEFHAEQEMRLILNGRGNIDDFVTSFDGEPFEGMTLRLFDPETRLWSMYWSDTVSGQLQTPTVGSWNGDVAYLFDKDTFEGRDILVAFKWDKSDPDHPSWAQAFSDDLGATWEWNWHMTMTRAE